MTFSLRLLFGAVLCASSLLSSAAPAQHFELRNALPGERSRVIVEFHGSAAAVSRVDAKAYDDLFARFRADLASGVSTHAERTATPRIAHEYRTVFLGAAIEAADAASIERVRALPYVRAVHEDRVVRASASPAVAPLATIVDARAKVNASSLGTSGAGIVVAVIDTGIDYTHPALGGGYGAGFKVAGGWDFINNDADPMDDNGHGTHVAGTIAASAPDLIGVAPDVTLLAYKVLSAAGNGATSGIIAALEYAADPNRDGNLSDHAAVANLSLGGPGDAEDPASRAVDNAVAAGIVVVVAAGNDGQTASIGSPGTAVDALTVAAIDDSGRVTDFSSRGPSPRLLGFKPDVAAPGFQIVSAKVGGGTIALNGTSMATPHVAGVAALLRKLHPEWTPSEVKAAITSSATSIDARPFARGAGRVDARAAHESTLLLSSSGLSFGIRPSRTGTSKETQTFRLTNRTSVTQSLTIAAGIAPAGVAVRVSRASVQLAPGASADVSVEIETANATVAFPNDGTMAGDIRITGSATATISWAFLRTARARMTYDGVGVHFVALGPGGARGNPLRDPRSAELFLPSGSRWDFMLKAYDAARGSQILLVQPDVLIDGDHELAFRASDATLEVVVDGRDESGERLSSRSEANEEIVHYVGTRTFWKAGQDQYSLLVLDLKKHARRLLYSPLSERYQLFHFEQFVDFDAAESYTIEHDALRGLAESKTLASGESELLATTVRWRDVPPTTDALTVCAYDALTDIINSSWSTCFDGPRPTSSSFVHRMNEERFPLAHNGMMFRAGGVLTQALRGRGGRTVVSSQITPPPTAEQIAPGGTLTITAGPAYPFAHLGTRNVAWPRFPGAGFFTASDGHIASASGTLWTTYDASGAQTASGVWLGYGGQVPPPSTPNARFVATRDDLPAAGRMTRGTLDVTFGADADLSAPTLTSLRVVDASGSTTDRLNPGENATLTFSVADVDYMRAGLSLPTRPEATRAWFRVAGTQTWQPLSVTVTGSESGTVNSLGHFPVGDIYAAALTPATAIANVRLDLRIEFADPAGNVVRWTHEGAIEVGNAPGSGGRRRGVRK